jgi:hypothetical protein
MRAVISTTFFFLFFSFFSEAQKTSGCLTQPQLLRMQNANLEDIKRFLYDEGWSLSGSQPNQVFDFFDYPLRFDVIQWQKNYSQSGKLFIYSAPNLERVVVLQTNFDCFSTIRSNFSSIGSKTQIGKDVIKTLVQQNDLTIEFLEYNSANSLGNNYTILVYDAKSVNLAIKELEEQKLQIAKREFERKELYLNTVAEADSLYKLGNFSLAKQNYERAQQLDPNFSLREKINLCIRGTSELMNNEADDLLNDRKFDLAIAKYKESLSYAAKHSFLKDQAEYSQRKIEYIEEIKDVLTIRKKKVFRYSELNTKDYAALKQTIINNLAQQIKINPNGNLNLQYQISFDTLGTNLSEITSFSSTISNSQNPISSFSKDFKLKPTQLDEFFVAAQDKVNLKSDWNTSTSTFRYNSNGLRPSEEINVELELIESYFKEKSFAPGKYTISVLEKNVNQNSYKDINLKNYTSIGPEAAFLSLLMPGTGTLAVSHGEIGWKRISSFLFFGGLAFAAQRYSVGQYKNYQTAIIQEEIDEYYTLANISHKASLVSAGIAASIYIHDFFWVIKRGNQNNRQKREMKKRINQGGISIQNQPIRW